ncbi:MAG: NAD(+) synthase [Breznakibacter sp.]
MKHSLFSYHPMSNIKVAVAQLNIVPGHPDVNSKKIIAEIKKAAANGDDLIVFPEMAVSGYLLGDEWENRAFVQDCINWNETIKNATQGITAIWGSIDIDASRKNEDGRIRKYNAAFIAQNGQYLAPGKIHKTLMPKYREFDDERHFYSSRKEAQDLGLDMETVLKPVVVTIQNKTYKIGILLCEDMWSDDYTLNPIDILLKNGSDLLVNLSCSPWTWRKNDKRHRVVRDRIKQHPVYFLYANNTGIQNNGKNIFLFDGNSTIYNPDGTLMRVANDYREETLRAVLFGPRPETVPNVQLSADLDRKELFAGLVYGIRKFMGNFSAPKVAIGLSGGIDSALSAALLSEAIGPENVYAINMPSQFNSETTKGAALQLAQNLGLHHTSIAIQHTFDYSVSQFESAEFTRMDGSGTRTPIRLSGLNKENIQARDRGSRILAGVASALGAVFVNNGNKTETALGYATLYGDVNGALAPIADLYKTEVYQLAQYINELKGREVIPSTIFNIPASAELSPDQNVDEGKGDPIFYPYHDKLVRAFVEFRLDPEDILGYYAEGTLAQHLHCEQSLIDGYFKDTASFIADLEHKWRVYKTSIFKRIQAPPIIAVSKRAFGYDLRESQNGIHYTQRYLHLKNKLLEIDVK